MNSLNEVRPMDVDVNGAKLTRGDYVQLTDAMILDDPVRNYGLGVGQVEHVFVSGKSVGIHVRFKSGHRVANNGGALEKVSLSWLSEVA
jgi:hypothetical protein